MFLYHNGKTPNITGFMYRKNKYLLKQQNATINTATSNSSFGLTDVNSK